MKFLALAAAALAIASPAVAQTNNGFTGARVEATVGLNDFSHAHDYQDVQYGAALGVDAPLGDRFTIGAQASTDNVFQRNRTIGAAARLGYVFTPRMLGYVQGGYSNYRDTFNISRSRTASENLDGGQAAVGVEYKLSNATYAKAQYRYTFYDRDVHSNSGQIGLGLRF